MAVVLVTNCTARKSARPEPLLCAGSLPASGISSLATEWRRRARRALDRIPAGQLYAGRGFRQAYEVAIRLGCDIHVVSAGFGVVGIDEPVPAYSLTVSPGSPDSVLSRCLPRRVATAAEWWEALTGLSGISDLNAALRRAKSSLIVLALPGPYLAMVEADLLAMAPRDLERIRIVGPKRLDSVPAVLHDYVMPYDERLNGPDTPMPGTELDFASRAAMAFLSLIHNDTIATPASEHARRVRLSLARMRRRRRLVRKRVTDRQVKAAIRAIRHTTDSMTEGLRLLRRRYRLACEQKRFGRLWMKVARA